MTGFDKSIMMVFLFGGLAGCDIPSIDRPTEQIPFHAQLHKQQTEAPTSTIEDMYAIIPTEYSINIDPPDYLTMNGTSFNKGAGHYYLNLKKVDVSKGAVYTMEFYRSDIQPGWSLSIELPVPAHLQHNSPNSKFSLTDNISLIWDKDETVPLVKISTEIKGCNITFNGSNIIHLTPVDPNKTGRYIPYTTKDIVIENSGEHILNLDPSFVFNTYEVDYLKSLEFEETNYDLYCAAEIKLTTDKYVKHDTYPASIGYRDTDSIYFFLNVSAVFN